MSTARKHLLGLNAAILLWGGTAMFAKGIDLPVTHIIGLRSLVAALALGLFVHACGGSVRMAKARHYGIMITLGLLLCGHWLTYFQALKISSAAVAILALHSYPVFTALLEPLLFRERFQTRDLVVALVMFGGMLVMTPRFSLADQTSAGILLGLVSALFFTGRNLIARACIHTYPGSVLMFWQCLVAGLVLVPSILGGVPVTPNPGTLGLFLLLGVVFTALPQTLYTASLQHVSARTVGILASLLPLYGAFFGYLIHNETLTPRTLAGGGLVLACVVFEWTRTFGKTVQPGD